MSRKNIHIICWTSYQLSEFKMVLKNPFKSDFTFRIYCTIELLYESAAIITSPYVVGWSIFLVSPSRVLYRHATLPLHKKLFASLGPFIREKIRRVLNRTRTVPFIRAVRVLFKARLIFSRINGPIVSTHRVTFRLLSCIAASFAVNTE